MRVPARSLAVLVALQALLLAAFLLVEGRREEEPPFLVEPLDEPAPPLLVSHDGRPPVAPGGPHLVHFWATWCGPCQEELPGLLPAAIVQDREGGAAARWGVTGLPDTFVVADGRLIARMGGVRDWSSSAARQYLQELRR